MPAFIIENTRGPHADPKNTHKPSMLLDAENDFPIEVEVIVGELVRMAQARNIEMPVSVWSSKAGTVLTSPSVLKRFTRSYL